MRKDLPDIVRALSSLNGVRNVGVTTNGINLKRKIPALHEAGLTHINVSARNHVQMWCATKGSMKVAERRPRRHGVWCVVLQTHLLGSVKQLDTQPKFSSVFDAWFSQRCCEPCYNVNPLCRFQLFVRIRQVSLDTLRSDRFAAITRRNGLDTVLASLDAALAHGYGGR